MFSKLITAIIVAVTLIACAGLSVGQQPTATHDSVTPEKRALIAELFELTGGRKTAMDLFNSVTDMEEKQLPDLVWQGVAGTEEFKTLSKVEQEELRSRLIDNAARDRKRINELFSQQIDFPAVIEKISFNLCDKYFTEAELKDLIAFYKSSTGKKSIKLMPKMFTESMAMTIEAFQPKMVAIMAQISNEQAEQLKKELESRKAAAPRKPVRRTRKPE